MTAGCLVEAAPGLNAPEPQLPPSAPLHCRAAIGHPPSPLPVDDQYARSRATAELPPLRGQAEVTCLPSLPGDVRMVGLCPRLSTPSTPLSKPVRELPLEDPLPQVLPGPQHERAVRMVIRNITELTGRGPSPSSCEARMTRLWCNRSRPGGCLGARSRSGRPRRERRRSQRRSRSAR